MNKTFKTIWNDVRRCYIVANEAQKSHGKPSKSAVALAVAATAVLTMGAANAAYVEPGFVATQAGNVDQATASWETGEYKADWGLEAIHASSAYALGYNGSGVTVGVMDSGAFMQHHPELAGDRFSGTHVTGEYGADGNRYPQSTEVRQPDGSYKYDPSAGLPYEKGEKFDVTGQWMEGVNDTHGTHVTGTVGANRDGSEFHGVAFGSDIVVGNTGATDSNNYGPFQDYDYFYAGWKAVADAVIAGNGGEYAKDGNLLRDSGRGGVINNSWGTNIRVNNGKHFPTDTITQAEYEYFLFKHNYADKYAGTDHAGKSFVDAAYDAVKGTNVVMIFTAGNRDFNSPFHRPLYPYFNPDAEKHWINVGGLQKDSAKEGNYKLWESVNEAGLAKYWTIDAPGASIYGSVVSGGEAGYSSLSGTSMSAPHVAGAMGVLMSRYQDMTAIQVRDVLFTTANHLNPDGSVMTGWANQDGSMPEEGEVSDRMGWGVVDLEKGMYGLGQLTGKFEYHLDGYDVWSNDISEVALNQRQEEEKAWYDAAKKWLANPTLELDDSYTEEEKKLIGNIALDTEDDIDGMTDEQEKISKEDAIAWRTEYFSKRIEAIDAKMANDNAGYNGSIHKYGDGTLVMTGKNTYEGSTVVWEGTMLAFPESIGVTNQVMVKDGATFGVLSNYNDNFTMKGSLTSKATAEDMVSVTLADGGQLYADAGSNVTLNNVTFKGEKKIVIGLAGASEEQLVKAYEDGATIDGSVTIAGETGDFEGAKVVGTEDTDYAFFEVSDELSISEDNKTIGVSAKSNGKTFADFATTKNGAAIASALEASSAEGLKGEVLAMTGAQVEETLGALSDDMYSAARNAFAVNSLTVSRTVIEQARSYGEGRAVEFENGRGRIWAAGVGQWMNADGASSSLNVDFGAGFVGAEWIATENTKIGAYFGYGTTKYEGASGKIDGDDLHYGIYGMSDIGPVGLTYGIGYTTEDRDSIRTFAGTPNAHSEDATALQVFAEAAYNDFYLGSVNIAPYIGYEWMRIETDGFSEAAMGHDFRMGDVEDDLQVATIGARVTAPVMVGKMPVAFKADVGYSRFFGDTESVTSMQLGNGGAIASIEGEELEGQVNFGLGVTAQIGKRATVGINYTGAYGSDTDTHGIGAALRVNF